MKCAFHPERDVAGYCPRCGKPLCAECFQAAQTAGACSACLAAEQPGAQPTAPMAPQPSSKRISPWLPVGLGCGCLVLLIVLGLLGVLPALYFLSEESATDETVAPVEVEVEPISPPEATAVQPGEHAALAFAQSRKPGWAVRVTDHSDDWLSAYVVLGPAEGDWTTWLDLRWDDGKGDYVLNDEGPIAQEEEGGEEVPDIYKPGEDVALEAALMENPDWVGKVVEHSSDWKSVAVWIGPPQSEWVTAVELQWNDAIDCYELVGREDIPYP